MPTTQSGIVATMLYAVVGIPLTLLTITNLGGFLATVFRWFYKNIISGVCCCAHCDALSADKRRKAAAAAAAATVEATTKVGRQAARSDSKRSGTVDPSTCATAACEPSATRSPSRESTGSTVRRHFNYCIRQR